MLMLTNCLHCQRPNVSHEVQPTLARRLSLLSVIGLCLISQSTAAVAQTSGTNTAAQSQLVIIVIFSLIALAVGIVVLFIPTIIAFRRQHPNRWAIAVISIGLSGTVIGWLGGLIWALQAVHKSPTGSNGGESGLNIFVNDPVTVRVEPYPAGQQPTVGPTTSTDELSDRLARLKCLFDQGAISHDEHDALRRSILATI